MAASLFIGRWQPFHDGHKALVETVLREGKDVVIALRDTPINAQNPLTVEERIHRIREALKDWPWERVKMVVIPDISEVCYGRGVGYGIREIRLDADTEAVSGTKVRASW